jgi:hypothetical protein
LPHLIQLIASPQGLIISSIKNLIFQFRLFRLQDSVNQKTFPMKNLYVLCMACAFTLLAQKNYCQRVVLNFDTVRNIQSLNLFNDHFLVGGTESAEIVGVSDGNKALKLTPISSFLIKSIRDVKTLEMRIRIESFAEQGVELLVTSIDNSNQSTSILLTTQSRTSEKDFQRISIAINKLGDYGIRILVGGAGAIYIDDISLANLSDNEGAIIRDRDRLRAEILLAIENQGRNQTIAEFNTQVDNAQRAYLDGLIYLPSYRNNLVAYDALSAFPQAFKSRLEMADPLSYDPFKAIITQMETIAGPTTATGLLIQDVNGQLNKDRDLVATVQPGDKMQKILGIGGDILNIITMGKSSAIINSIKSVAAQIYNKPNLNSYVETLGVRGRDIPNRITDLTKQGYDNYLFMQQFFIGIESDRRRVNDWLFDINQYNLSVQSAEKELDSLTLTFFRSVNKEVPQELKDLSTPNRRLDREASQRAVQDFFTGLRVSAASPMTSEKKALLAKMTRINQLILDFDETTLSLKNSLRFSFNRFLSDFDTANNPFASIPNPTPRTIEARDKYNTLKASANGIAVDNFKRSLSGLLR